jgi:molecular chaperone DnaK
MKDEASANAEADKKEKERIDKLNQADSVIFQTEKQLKEIGDKLPADKKVTIEAALIRLKDAHKAQDATGIDSAMADINSAFQAASQDMCNAQANAGAGNAGTQSGASNPGSDSSDENKGDNVTDVDFEEVK